MTLSQQTLLNAAYKHGAIRAGATALHGWARFKSEANARLFCETMLTLQWSVTRYKQDQPTEVLSCVDWQQPRLPNGTHKRDGVY